jgi:hypothetical protein
MSETSMTDPTRTNQMPANQVPSNQHAPNQSSANQSQAAQPNQGAVPDQNVASDTARKPLTPAAQRALAETEARHAEAERLAALHPHESQKEWNGPKGPEPTRYGDWERKGIASDF